MDGAYEKYALEENHEFYVCSEIEGKAIANGIEIKRNSGIFVKMGYKK